MVRRAEAGRDLGADLKVERREGRKAGQDLLVRAGIGARVDRRVALALDRREATPLRDSMGRISVGPGRAGLGCADRAGCVVKIANQVHAASGVNAEQIAKMDRARIGGSAASGAIRHQMIGMIDTHTFE